MDTQDIRQWTDQTMGNASFSEHELNHVTMCLEHIWRWYHEDYPLGGFLTALVRNDFCEAFFRADDVDLRALYIYAIFLASKMPSDYRKKAIS